MEADVRTEARFADSFLPNPYPGQAIFTCDHHELHAKG